MRRPNWPPHLYVGKVKSSPKLSTLLLPLPTGQAVSFRAYEKNLATRLSGSTIQSTMIPFTTGTCLFENRRQHGVDVQVYENPVGVIEARAPSEVPGCLRALDAALANGLHVAGYMGYEASYSLEPRLRALAPSHNSPLPLLRFYTFEDPIQFDPRFVDEAILGGRRQGHVLSALAGDLSRSDYVTRIEKTLELIRAGDIYQANFTFPLRGHLQGDALSLYAALRVAQPVAYGAFLRMEEADILSLSPELFVARRGDELITRPMKGTAARATNAAEDPDARRRLQSDPKERAENLMIVDLLRNDLSRVCNPGSVSVPNLFDVETYPSLHTMVSDVTGVARGGVKVSDILQAMFPCGSVTGAPKIRAMEVIADLEGSPRGAYTGSIGYMTPDGDFQFNVAIRTLTAFADGTIVYPVGGGIVADSHPQKEYDECLLKSQLLNKEVEPFDLIETIGWSPDKDFTLLELHLNRLLDSAEFYGRPVTQTDVMAQLNQAILRAGSAAKLKVRLTLDANGRINVTTAPLDQLGKAAALNFVLSETSVDSADPQLRHKTTHRKVYTEELSWQRELTGCDEVVFLNQYDELTEGTWTNLFVKEDGIFLTPPVSCGLLPGVLREYMLNSSTAREAVLTVNDLRAAKKIYLGNSVRGLMPARFIG